MDDFLTAMYAEEQEKVASVELESFMDTLPASELEEFLGLSKLGVAGPADPELPSEESGKLSKEQKKTEAVVTKMQEKRSQGFGDEGMGDGMETTASIKADIAMRAMRVTKGAPPHIKAASARFAGHEMAKVAGIGNTVVPLKRSLRQ